ncbi:MAG: TolC family protein, partial [Terriglobia bacterium]
RKLERLDRLIALNRESIRLTEARVREGDAAPLERQLLSVEVGREEAERALTLGRLEAAVLDLKQVAGMNVAEPLTLAPPAPAPAVLDAGTLRERALRDRPDVRLARLMEEQSESETRLAQAGGKPDLTLSASYSRQYARFDEQLGLSAAGAPVPLRDRDDVLSVGVQIPLGTRRRNQGSVEAAGARAASARIRREYLESRVPAEVAAALRRFQAAQSSLAIFDSRILGPSDKNLDIIRQAYQLGQFRLLDVLNEQRRLIETQLSFIDAQTELAKALADLERAVGGRIQ